MVQALTENCQKGGFTLTKWISNSCLVLQTIEEEHRAKDWKELDLDRDELSAERALGLQWCVKSNTFKFKMVMKEQPQSRQGMLSIISSVYDPLGSLHQHCQPKSCCKSSVGDVVDGSTRYLQTLVISGQVGCKIRKSWHYSKLRDALNPQLIKAQLHNFSDTRQDGFGTATYLRIVDCKSMFLSCLVKLGSPL